MVFFTVHYLVLRGFYALERTRTVFFIQCAVAATNIVVAIVLVARTDAKHTAPALVLAYTASYAVGSVAVLPRAAPGARRAAHPELVRFLVRLAIAAGRPRRSPSASPCCCPAATSPATWAPCSGWSSSPAPTSLVFLALTRALRLTEVTAVLDTVTRRLRPRSRSSD